MSGVRSSHRPPSNSHSAQIVVGSIGVPACPTATVDCYAMTSIRTLDGLPRKHRNRSRSGRIPMPCPIRRRGSANWYFRGTIPKALRPKIAAMPKHMRPAGWSPSGDIWISLKTPDREQAKVRCAEVTAEVANTIRSLSAPARSLNKEERVALAGDAYRGFVAMTKGEPGEAEDWKAVAVLWKRARDGHSEAVNQ